MKGQTLASGPSKLGVRVSREPMLLRHADSIAFSRRAAARRSEATAERSIYAFFERSELMLTLPAKIGGGGRVGAQSGAERAPRPPSILSRSANYWGEGGVSGACAPRR